MIERTLVLIKPDGVQRAIVGEIITRFERVGLKMVGLKLVQSDEDSARKHYFKDDVWFEKVGKRTLEDAKKLGIQTSSEDPIVIGKEIHQGLIEFITMSPVVAIVFEGHDAVNIVRKIVGDTYPTNALPGTIRGDYTFDSAALSGASKRSIQNLIHASGEVDEAKDEIAIWFREDELHTWRRVDEDLFYRKN